MPRNRPPQRPSGLRVRLVVFAVLALAIAGAAAFAVWPKTLVSTDSGETDVSLRVDMGGFTPAVLNAPAGRAVRVRIVNPDSSHHSDGGGIHGFTIVKLGIDAKIQPLSTGVVTIPASDAGDYAFYCDTCCGGKENPAMQGVLRLTA